MAAAAASAPAATWDGSEGNGLWTDPLNWSGDDAPDTAGEDALIDGNAEVNSIVGLDIAGGASIGIGALTIDIGDRLNFRGTATGTANFSVTALANAGTLELSPSPGNNGAATVMTVGGTGAVFNASAGLINIRNTSGRNRIQSILDIGADNQNDGTIDVYLSSGDRDNASLRLRNSGTFTNNGEISLTYNHTAASSSTTVSVRLQDSGSSVTLAGSGMITLAISDVGSTEARILGGGATLTNGASHTIQGAGHVGAGLTLVNEGLLKSDDAIKSLTIDPTTSITNSATGRIVARGAGGMVLGSTGDQIINAGLIEAGAGSQISIGTGATVDLGGTLRGGGTISATALAFTSAATLAPGDSAASNGTGASTTGQLQVVGNLSLGAGTTLAYQLASTPAANDQVAVTGDLAVGNVTLDIEQLAGFEQGTYTLITYTGTFTDNGLPVAWEAGGYGFSLANVYNDETQIGGQLNLTVVPEPASLGLLALAGGLLGRRRRRRD